MLIVREDRQEAQFPCQRVQPFNVPAALLDRRAFFFQRSRMEVRKRFGQLLIGTLVSQTISESMVLRRSKAAPASSK